jgi:hypothetical protein
VLIELGKWLVGLYVFCIVVIENHFGIVALRAGDHAFL